MKIFTISIAAFLIIYLMFGCSKMPGNAAKKTIVCGKVVNRKANPEIKDYKLELTDYSGTSNHVGHIDSNGSFKIVFDQFIAEDVKLDHTVGTFIAHPGDSIHIDIDFNNRGSIKFSGDGSKTNSDIYKYTSEFYSDYDSYNHPYTDANDYKAYCENLKDGMQKKMNEFSASTDPNEETKEWIKNYINIQYYSALLYFPVRYCYYNHIQLSNWKALKGYYNMAGLDNASKPSVLNSGYYGLTNRYLNSYLRPEILRKQKTFTYAEIINSVDKQLAGNELFKQIVLGSILDLGLNMNDVSFYNENKSLIEPNLQTFISQPLHAHYTKVQNDFKNAHLNMNAKLKNIAGTPAQGIIDSIRRANKGKIVYIDFWATWCGPCLMEMPASKKLQKKLEKEKVTFVYVCLDSKPDTWKFTLSKLNLTGVQYYCDKQQSGSLKKVFNINGIPFHMLLNKNGDIVDSGNYLQASNPLTEKKIIKLLSKSSIDKQVISSL